MGEKYGLRGEMKVDGKKAQKFDQLLKEAVEYLVKESRSLFLTRIGVDSSPSSLVPPVASRLVSPHGDLILGQCMGVQMAGFPTKENGKESNCCTRHAGWTHPFHRLQPN